jgi:hypothetical protein
MITQWTYQGNPIVVNPEGAIGFIYLLTTTIPINGATKYIGRKMLYKTKTTTKKGKKTKTQVDSDWRDYWSSSPEILKYIEEHGTDGITREVLLYVNTKSEMLYSEEWALYHTNAILSNDYINGNIRSKVFRKWFEKNKTQFLEKLLRLKLNL